MDDQDSLDFSAALRQHARARPTVDIFGQHAAEQVSAQRQPAQVGVDALLGELRAAREAGDVQRTQVAAMAIQALDAHERANAPRAPRPDFGAGPGRGTPPPDDFNATLRAASGRY